MGSVRDSAPDPNRASDSARQPCPPRMRPLPTSDIAPATLPRSICWAQAMTSGRTSETTMIYTHVLIKEGCGVQRPVHDL